MPRRDGSGPTGAGPMTGRALGTCTGAKAAKYALGMGMGLGLGFACRRGFGGRRGFARGFRNRQKAFCLFDKRRN